MCRIKSVGMMILYGYHDYGRARHRHPASLRCAPHVRGRPTSSTTTTHHHLQSQPPTPQHSKQHSKQHRLKNSQRPSALRRKHSRQAEQLELTRQRLPFLGPRSECLREPHPFGIYVSSRPVEKTCTVPFRHQKYMDRSVLS